MSKYGYEITFYEINNNNKSLDKEIEKEKEKKNNSNDSYIIDNNINKTIKNFMQVNFDKENFEFNSYNSDDDIENQQLIHFVSKSNNSDCQQNSNQTIIEQDINPKDKKINLIDKKEIFQNMIYFRILNSISIIILICAFTFTSFKRLNNSNDILTIEKLNNFIIQSEYNSLILNIGVFLVIISFVFAFLRNIYIRKDSNFEYLEVKEIVCIHFGALYYKANILLSFCLLLNYYYNKTLNFYGFDFFICIISFFLYFRIYLNHMKRQSKIKINQYFNFIAFDLNISFTLAWNICFLTLTSSEFINGFIKNENYNLNINLMLQIFLTLISILTISYFADVYFCVIIVIFQIGNTFNKHLFDFEIKKDNLNERQNIQLSLTLFTIICLLGGVIKKQKSLIKKETESLTGCEEEKEINEINNHYENDNNQFNFDNNFIYNSKATKA